MRVRHSGKTGCPQRAQEFTQTASTPAGNHSVSECRSSDQATGATRATQQLVKKPTQAQCRCRCMTKLDSTRTNQPTPHAGRVCTIISSLVLSALPCQQPHSTQGPSTSTLHTAHLSSVSAGQQQVTSAASTPHTLSNPQARMQCHSPQQDSDDMKLCRPPLHSITPPLEVC